MPHIVLLGDSIFDNKAYVGSEPDVEGHLRGLAPSDWNVTLSAVDGAVVENVAGQLNRSPHNATHYVISAGGNNAIQNADILNTPVSSSAQAYSLTAERVDTFRSAYEEMLAAVLDFRKPVVLCTVYFPNFPDPFLQRIASTALSAFNDVIILAAISHCLPLIDLRLVCTESSDYANEIEPSDAGGRKIASAILKCGTKHDFTQNRTSVYY